MSKFKKLVSQPLFLPIFCMILVMAVNIIYDVMAGNFAFNFFTISIRNGVLYGRIIDILNRGSEIAILAIGMTLVVSCSAGVLSPMASCSCSLSIPAFFSSGPLPGTAFFTVYSILNKYANI